MKPRSFRFAHLLVFLAPGCAPSPGSGDAQQDAASILLGNENNYRTSSSLSLPTVDTASGADLDICWTNIATDMQCHAVAPETDIDNVAFLRFLHLSQAEVETKLISGELTQAQIDGYLEFPTENRTTCTRLSRFSFLGTQVDVLAQYQESSDETYLLLFTHGLERGVGARVMMFLRPLASSTSTRVDAASGCGTLAFAADLTTPTKVVVSAAGPWIVDWRKVTRDGQGNEVLYSTLDKLLIGYYEGAVVADIQAKLFDLEIMATSLWDLDLAGGYSADLSQAIERSTGKRFAGFDRAAGVWLLALTCSTCQNPAPAILSILEPRGHTP